MKSVHKIFTIGLLSFLSCTKQVGMKEVKVLGSIHKKTQNINPDSILQVLNQYQANVLLVEAHIPKDKDINPKEEYDNEVSAVIAYKRKNPSISVHHIEFKDRDEHRANLGIYPEAGFVYNLLQSEYEEGKLRDQEAIIWQTFSALWAKVDSIAKGSIYTLNQPSTDSLVSQLLLHQYTLVKHLVDTLPVFEKHSLIDARGDTVSFRSYFDRWATFEYDDRNSAMAENILSALNKYESGKFLILIGYKHRLPIIERLTKYQVRHRFTLSH